MWYSINKTNGIKLKRMHKNLLIPLLNYMAKYKKIKCCNSFDVFLKSEYDEINRRLEKIKELKDKGIGFSEEKKLLINEKESQLENELKIISIIQYSLKLKNKKILFLDIVNIILANDNVNAQIGYFYFQNNELKKKAYFISKYEHSKEWVIFFKLFFYEKFFTMESIWSKIDGFYYTRENFHDNFIEDNNINVCPYCDSDTIYNYSNSEVEHFWPESIYPNLAISPMNLFTSCQACNRPAQGKGTRIKNPIVMPFFREIGRNMHFKPNLITREMSINCDDKPTENYVELMNLEKRYSKKIIYNTCDRISSSIYESIIDARSHGYKVEQEDIAEYIKDEIKPKKNPFYFAVSSILSDL